MIHRSLDIILLKTPELLNETLRLDMNGIDNQERLCDGIGRYVIFCSRYQGKYCKSTCAYPTRLKKIESRLNQPLLPEEMEWDKNDT